MPLVVFKNGTPLDANDLNNNFGQLTTASGVGSDTSPGSSFAVNGATGSARRINFLTAGLTDATVGLDTGNDFVIDRYKSGVSQERVVQVSNASGITTINSTAGLTLQGTGGTTTLGGSLKMGSTTATGLGTGIGQIPVFVNYNASGHPGLKTTGRIIIGRQTTTENDFADLQVNRDSSSVVTTNQTLLNSGIRVIQTTGSQDQSLNWALASTITNNQDTGAGNSVAIVGYASRTKALNGAYTFGGVLGSFDSSGLPSLTSKGGLIGTEFDVAAYDVDNAVNGFVFGGKGTRIVVNIVALRQSASGTNQTEISQGIWFSTSANPVSAGVDSHTNFNSMIGTAVNAQAYQMLDARGGIAPTGYTDPFAAVRMSANQIIDFNGGAALNSNAGDYIQYTTTGTARIRVMNGANENLSIAGGTGNVITRGTLQVNSSGTAPITISSGTITSTTSQALNIVTGGAGFAVNIGNTGAGLGQVINVTTNTGGNSLDGSSGNVLNVINRLTAGFYQSTGLTHSLSGSTMTKVGLSLSESYTGTTTATDPYGYRLSVGSDTVDASGAANAFTGLSIARNFGGTGTKGSRGGLRIQLTQIGGAYTDTGSPTFVASEPWVTVNANIGGTGTGTLAKGNLHGSNDQILMLPGATWYQVVNASGEKNLAVYASNRRLTLSGTVTAGDVLNIIFTGGTITGSPVTVSWTTGASQTLVMVANNLEAAVNNNTNLRAAGISAKVSSGGNLELYWITTLSVTITTSQTGSGTTTMTLGSITTGASVVTKLMASLVPLSDDSSPALGQSAMLLMGAQSYRAFGGMFDYGITFGGLTNYSAAWPIAPGGALISANLQNALANTGKSGLMAPNKATYGVDFRYVYFATTGAAWRTPGFIIGYDGSVYVSGSKISADNTGLQLDATTGATASAVALSSGGGGGAGVNTNNYFIGDVGFVYGGILEVTGVNASTGAVTLFNVIKMPSYQSGAAPSNPATVDGGSGSGWTVTITWPTPANGIVKVQPTGGPSTVGGTVTLSALPGSTSYANDAAAAGGGVAVGQLYRNGSVVQVRVT